MKVTWNGSFTHDKDLAGVPVRVTSAPSASIVQWLNGLLRNNPMGQLYPSDTQSINI